MSDDKQLTVAELLARAGKEESDADGTSGGRARSGKEGSEKPRRRRRRSMEDGGGVSVAELTGSFPKVKAKPKESKHGSPIDEPDGQGSRQVENTEKAGNAPKAENAEKVGNAEKAENAENTPKAESKAAPKTPNKAAVNAPHKAAEPAQTAAGQPTTKPGTPGPASTPVQGKPATKATQQEPSVDKNAATKSETKRGAQTSPAADETAEISRVTDKSDSSQATSSKQHDAESTGETPKVTDSPSNTAKRGGTASASTRERRQADDDTSEIQSVPDNAAQDAAAQRHDQAPVYADAADLDDQDESVSEGESMNPVAVILLALAGIVLGVVVFKGFEMLWDVLNNYLVAALAVGVTGVMAGIVHALRTERDGLSMTLAVIVGLLLTFGPAVLVL